MRIPTVEDLTTHHESLANVVANTSWLPNPATVKMIHGAVFPTRRLNRSHGRFDLIQENGVPIGMFDDNATPEWAMFWAHGLTGTRPKGWTIAHVWPTSDDMASFTHLANLAMIPEPLASLTDKVGPLVAYLRWHAWEVYGWKPTAASTPIKPPVYDSISWRYLPHIDDPKTAIRQRFCNLSNQRTSLLRPIMERINML